MINRHVSIPYIVLKYSTYAHAAALIRAGALRRLQGTALGALAAYFSHICNKKVTNWIVTLANISV